MNIEACWAIFYYLAVTTAPDTIKLSSTYVILEGVLEVVQVVQASCSCQNPAWAAWLLAGVEKSRQHITVA